MSYQYPLFHDEDCTTNWMGDYYCDCGEKINNKMKQIHDPLCSKKNYYDRSECNCQILTQARSEGYNEGYRDGCRTGDYLP